MNTLARHLVCAVAVALLVGCGGSDPRAAAEPTADSAAMASSSVVSGTGLQRGEAEAATAASVVARQSHAIRAGAATTQDVIDQAIAANTANNPR